MSFWDRIRNAFRPQPASGQSPASRGAPNAPPLDEMRTVLRVGMTRDEFFSTLDAIVVKRGLRVRLPTATDRLVALPVAEGDELLCFLPEGVLNYVEYRGGVFLEKSD